MLKNTLGNAEICTESRSDRAARAIDFAAQWLFSDAMRRLLHLFDEQMPEATTASVDLTSSEDWLPLDERLPTWLPGLLNGDKPSGRLAREQLGVLDRTLAIERMTADDFNFRRTSGSGYRERAQAISADFGEDLRTAVLTEVDRLGLVQPIDPRYRRYDKTLVLGGGYRSPLLRARFASRIAATGVELGRLYFLGSPRFLISDPPEALDVADYAPRANDEFDLMVAAAQREFDLRSTDTEFLCGCATSAEICPRWRRDHSGGVGETPPQYTHERCTELQDEYGRTLGTALSASTGRPPYRPDTSDTFRLWARIANPEAGQQVLIVTTQVFVPFQTFDATKRLYLEHGADVDVVGFGAEWGDRPLTAEYTLQETLSSIRSARRLIVDAVGILRDAEPN